MSLFLMLYHEYHWDYEKSYLTLQICINKHPCLALKKGCHYPFAIVIQIVSLCGLLLAVRKQTAASLSDIAHNTSSITNLEQATQISLPICWMISD